eukprot:11520526-Alexandrium_andersonii.AAC.1
MCIRDRLRENSCSSMVVSCPDLPDPPPLSLGGPSPRGTQSIVASPALHACFCWFKRPHT